jgi:hypothetical protein
VRTFAHPNSPLTPASFAQALKAGNGYVSHGPLIFPSIMFGTRVEAGPGRPVTLAVDLQSIAGLKGIELISHAAVVESRDLRDRHEESHVQFTLSPDRSTWYSLVVEDVQGQKAFTDPIWVDSTAGRSQSATDATEGDH